MQIQIFVALVIVTLASAEGENSNHIDQSRDGRLLSLFNVVRFNNEICTGGSKNGTCYSAEECTNLGGNNDGSCASGYGVCCTFTLSCGGTSSQNCTYIEQASATSVSETPCDYTIHKCNNNVCRIRLDFTTFSIEGPETSSVASPATVTTTGGALGDCTGDTFTVTSPGSVAPPLICGFNTGQHMFVDASDLGHVLSFAISSSTSTSRSWTIKATQYECNDLLGGPPGCLQYFTGSSGSFASFNFPTTSSTVGGSAQHLSNQHYSMCFRRESGNCAICFTPVIATSTSITAQASFGLGVSPDAAAAQSGVSTECSADYLGISNGVTAAIAAISQPGQAVGITRICGRFFNAATAQTASVSVCTRTRPFRLVFFSNEDELTTTANMADAHELDEAPGGTVGFNLAWTQLSC